MSKRKQHIPKRLSETSNSYVWESRQLAVFQNELQDVSVNNGNGGKKRTKWANDVGFRDDVLQSKLAECFFYLKIDRCGVQGPELTLGTITLEVKSNFIPECSEFWLYVSGETCKSFLYFEVGDCIQYYTIVGALDTEFYSALSRKYFVLKCKNFDSETCKVKILVVLAEPECQRLQQKHQVPELQVVMSHFYQITVPVFEDNGCMTNHNVQELYDAVKQYHLDTAVPVKCLVEHVNLKLKLRPYQVQAVCWMLGRESQSQNPETQDQLHCLFAELKLLDGRTVYFNKFSGHVLLEKPVSKPLPTGGILADEMGLGKTVEILAIILMNPRKNIPEYTCVKQEDDISFSNFVPVKPLLIDDKDDMKAPENTVSEIVQLSADIEKRKMVSSARKPTKRNVSKITKKTKRKKATDKNPKDTADSINQKPQKKVSQLRLLLQQWYNESLSGMDRKPFKQIRVSVHCPCGQERLEEERVRCSSCARWQHQTCVNYAKGRRERYLCPQCWQNKDPIISGCTLIVTPNSICSQWVDEIHTHISNEDFKVLVYRGVHSVGFIQPFVMAEYDIVITTYETLRKELDFDINSAKHKMLRHEKRFVSPPSPLSCVSWWRICLDEAQMVEGACKAAEMVQRMSTTHRWAITGTPVQKTFQDLYGLLLFLGVDPYCELRWWQELLYKPYCHNNAAPLLQVMCQFMWRTQKRDVLQQMGVPELKEELIFLHFSPIEEFYYRCQHLSSSAEFQRKLLSAYLDTPFDSMDRQILAKILVPLVQLRQACVHPHAVRRGAVHLIGSKNTMTMEQVLESMIKKTKTDCEEELRKHISSLNGMAGINIINEKYTEAVELYRQVLRTSEEHAFLKTDALQKIHAMYNLTEILQLHSSSGPPTLRDDTLLQEVKNLETEYMSKHETLLASSQKIVNDLALSIEEVHSDFYSDQDYWWTSALEQLSITGAMPELLNLIMLELDCQPHWLREKPSVASVLHHLQSWTQSVVQERKKVMKDLKKLQMVPCLELVNEALNCHLRVQYKNKTRLCQSCRHESLLKNYESYLFAVSKNQTKHTLVGEVLILGQLNQGSWKPNIMELVLKKVLSCARTRGLDSQFIEDGNTYFKWLDLLKKEFKNLRVLWRQIHDKVSAVDELNMSKLRLRLRMDDEPLQSSMKDPHNLRSMEPDSLAKIHVIDHFQVDMYETKLYNERELSLSELKKKTGQLFYLQNLRKDSNLCTQPCPICQGELKDKWNVLECGHCFCLECVTTLLNQMNRNRTLVRCPVCRELSDHKNMSYVVIDDKCKQGEASEDEISVRGSYSTKVEAIVRRLLTLKKKDPYVKALVFSMWDKVLDILENALMKNDITFTRVRAGTRNKDSVKQFKLTSGDSHITALLLPVHLGSKGLNLTEATHVLLTEPILNPTDELQVLGRLHRIGQTRETFVHRFLIYNTIEERIHLAMQSGADQWTTGKVTLRKFQELFVQVDDT